jgi:hypothetical protein
MTRILPIVLTGVAAGVAMWWYRSQQMSQQMTAATRGEVIYRNTPLSGTGE